MDKSRDVVLKLLRFAMGWEEDYHLPNDIVWSEVLSIADEQGVVAIALDGYEAYINKVSNEKQISFTPKDKVLILESIGRMQLVEHNYYQHKEALLKLSDILHRKAIPFMVMKGFACGQYYPIPKHRECGDIDIYPGEKFNESNQALKEAGVPIDDHYYRHTVSYLDGIMLENHRVLADLRGPKKQTRELETWLELLANESMEKEKQVNIGDIEMVNVSFPNASYNAIFLPWHVSAHFCFERVTLRHLLDWSLFLTHDGKSIDMDLLHEAKNRFTYGYSKMVDILTNLSLRYLCMPKGDIPLDILRDAESFDDKLADKVFEYMFIGQPRERDKNVWKFRLNNVKRIWKERWKYKEVYGISMMSFLIHKIKGVLFKEGE